MVTLLYAMEGAHGDFVVCDEGAHGDLGPDSLLSICPSRQVGLLEIKNRNRTLVSSCWVMVIRLGLEPKTYCLEGSCSIQLSYRTIVFTNRVQN